jgi:hypothetical protein
LRLFLEQAQDIVQSSFPRVNEVMELLDGSVVSYCKILDKKFQFNCGLQNLNLVPAIYESRCEEIRSVLEGRVRNVDSTFAATFTVSYDRSLQAFDQPQIPKIPTYRSTTSVDIRARALLNISPLDHPSDLLVISSLLPWTTKYLQLSLSHREFFIYAQLILKRIETFVFSQFLSLFQREEFSGLPSFDDRKDEGFATDLEKLVDNYRIIAKHLLESEHVQTRLKVNIKSQTVLVCVSSLCFIFECAKLKYPILCDYSLAISLEDLGNLVFSCSQEIDVLKKVSSYLTIHQNQPQIFHLIHQDQTRDLAKRFGSAYLSHIWKQETKAARARVDARWEVICEKQRRLVSLRQRLAELERELSLIPDEYSSRRWIKSSEYYEVQKNVNSKKKEIEDEAVAPPKIIQPLPFLTEEGFEWIFYLFMPTHIKFISTFTLISKQLIVPSDNKTIKECCEPPLQTNISAHYSSHKPSFTSSPNSKINVRSSSIVPSKFGSRTVDLIFDHYDGVFHPKSWMILIQCDPFNPFHPKINKGHIINNFTESLPKISESIQWALAMNPTPERGNLGIVSQNKSPYWLRKPAYLTYTSLRAFPLSQLRNLAICLHKRELPLDQKEVQILIRQLLYQVGPITPDETREWVGDSCASVMSAISDEVSQLCIEWRGKQRDSTSFLLLAEIAAYVSQFDHVSNAAVSTLIEILGEWTTSIESTISHNHDPNEICKLRLRQCLYNIYIVNSLGGSRQLPPQQLDMFCRMSLLIRMGLSVEGLGQDDYERVTELRSLCYYTLVGRLDELLSFISDHPSSLTKAVQCIIETTPNNVRWSTIPLMKMCYESWDEYRNHYAVNVLTGMVLLNGVPPRSLPPDILNHRMYRRTFGDTNFETLILSNGWIESSRLVFGRKYRIQLLSDSNQLLIQERRAGDEENDFLQLVDATTDFNYLPPRLREMHSHWYSPLYNTLLLRPVNFSKRNISFVVRDFQTTKPLVYSVSGHEHIEYDVWRNDHQDDKWDQLIPPNLQVAKVISKFENQDFVHFYKTPHGSLKIHFPRYNLSFESSEFGFRSLDYPNMVLSQSQQFAHTLPKFSKYLILENIDDETRKKLTVPLGEIELQDGVNIIISGDCAITCSYYVYSIHQRFGILEASDVESRMYLASLYSACSSQLPDSLCGMTGEEYAMVLLRQCQLSRPLCDEEKRHLLSCSKFVKHTPALYLLCFLNWKTSEQLQFLSPNSELGSCPFNDIGSKISIAYMNQIKNCNPRKRLFPGEEMVLLGYTTTRSHGPLHFELDLMEISDPPVSSSYVLNYESILCNICVDHEIRPQPEVPPFPLNSMSKRSCLVDEYLDNLKQSWATYFKSVAESKRLINLRWRLIGVKKRREEVQSYIFGSLNSIPDGINFLQIRLLKWTSRLPTLSPLDLIKIALDPNILNSFNPCLSVKSKDILFKAIILWMELCVLEDKITRMDFLFRGLHSPEEGLVRENLRREILTIRTWDSSKHVSWLVFEVLGGLQIRPHQYAAVLKLIQNPGMISQINMGEGKTRVLLPLLCLYFSKHSDAVVRIIMLSNILEEGYDYLHRYLCATAINMRILLISFHRDVEISRENASLLLHILRSIRGQNACVIMSPESCLSFHLKVDELTFYNDRNEILPILKHIEDLKYCNFLDESDEELSHKYRLIYSIGLQMDLSSGPTRWECILHTLWLISASVEIHDLVRSVGVFASEMKPLCSFQPFYLPTNQIDDQWQLVIEKLANSIMQSPPHLLRWMSHGYESEATRVQWLEYLTNPVCSFDLDDKILRKENRMDAMYALRGLLAHGLLKTCLQSRHRVQFGVCRPHPKQKRMAIPFRANNVPAERSEFKQPDVALVYTCLSYFSDGLSLEEVREALKLLLSLGTNAQSHEYNLWLESHSHIPSVSFDRINDVNKIDISNQDQLVEVHKYFGVNMRMIGFWLRHILFPDETPQHIHSIQRTPWHLCGGPRNEVRGFSGTNDTRFLLPLHVRQESFDEISDIERKSSSGKMIHLLLEKSSQFISMPPVIDEHFTLQWQKLLILAINLRTHALIDTGALLTGISNVDAADFYLTLPESPLRAVVYFEIAKKSWMVKSRNGQIWSLHSSPIQPIDCFTIFDEGRCRGADIILRPTAIGLVTLGPKMTKDKLMQGLGRLRMLDRTQTIILIGSEDVSSQIRQMNSSVTISPHDVLQWVIQNTIRMIRDGLVEWAIMGAHSSLVNRETNQIAMTEPMSCEDFYSGRNQFSSLSDLFQSNLKKLVKMFGVESFNY